MFGRLIDIRPGERQRLVLAFFSLLLVIAAYTTIKAVRDALFLSKFGVTQLSFIAIGLALATGFIISIYLRVTGGMARNRLIAGTNITIAVILAGIWAGLFQPNLASILPWVLYILSSIFGVFIVMQFWLLTNDLFDPREAKRLFGIIGAGANLGGILGGYLPRLVTRFIGSANLLLVAGGMLLVEAVLVSMVWPLRRRDIQLPKPGKSKDKAAKSGGFSTLSESASVRMLALAVLLSVVATTLMDWQFKGIVKFAYEGRTDEMTMFFGSLYGALSVASLLVQSVFTGGVLRRFGVGVGLLLLPGSLLLGSTFILSYTLVPGLSRLVAASAAKVAEGGLRFSIDKASMELMWLPVPAEIKERGKSFVDTVVDRFGTGLTGFIWLGLAALGWDTKSNIHLISMVVIAAAVVWVVVLLRTRSAYLGALREILARRTLDMDGLRQRLRGPEAEAMIRAGLGSTDEAEVAFALHVLQGWDGPLPKIEGWLERQTAPVQVQALRMLTSRKETSFRERVVACLRHEDPAVRQAAVVYLHTTAPAGVADPLAERLTTMEGVDRALVEVIRLGNPATAVAAAGELERRLEVADGSGKVALLGLLGGAPPEMAAALLAGPLAHGQPDEVRAALDAVGRSGATGLCGEVARLLDDTRYRRMASECLALLGRPAIDELLALLHGSTLTDAAERAALRVLGGSNDPDSAPALFVRLSDANFVRSSAAARALVRLRKGGLSLSEAQLAVVDKRLLEELQIIYKDLQLIGLGSYADLCAASPSDDLLVRFVAERAHERVALVFRMVALADEPEAIEDAYRGVRSPLKAVRASSLEFLDNVLAKSLSAQLLPLLEGAGPERFADSARAVVGEAETREAVLRGFLAGGDQARAVVAAWTVANDNNGKLADALSGCAEGADVAVAAVARRALARLKREPAEETTVGLTVIEKALKLQKVDVLAQVSMDDLIRIAGITQELEVAAGEPIYLEGDTPDALFVLVSGAVRLHKGEVEIDTVSRGDSFGGWALVDDSPRVASATATEAAVLLKVTREDFVDLLSDRVDIVQAVFKTMVDRLRNLARVAGDLDSDSE